MEAQRLGHPVRSLCGCQSSRAAIAYTVQLGWWVKKLAVFKQSEQ